MLFLQASLQESTESPINVDRTLHLLFTILSLVKILTLFVMASKKSPYLVTCSPPPPKKKKKKILGDRFIKPTQTWIPVVGHPCYRNVGTGMMSTLIHDYCGSVCPTHTQQPELSSHAALHTTALSMPTTSSMSLTHHKTTRKVDIQLHHTTCHHGFMKTKQEKNAIV